MIDREQARQAALWSAAFVASCVGATLALLQWGIVPVGFGLVAPAGVYLIGFSFTARDMVHDRMGSRGVVLLILVAAMLSSVFSPRYALAGGASLALAELSDLVVYAPLRRRQWMLAVIASNLMGAVVDSAMFLWCAFGSLDTLAGLVVGKAWMTVAAVPVLRWLRR